MGKKTTKTHSTTTLPAWAQPLAQNAANTMSAAVNANQPAAQQTADAIRGQLPMLAGRAFGSDPTLGAANNYTQDVIGGKYLQGNPFLDQMIGQSADDVTDRINSMFGQSGGSLGTPHAQVLAKELLNAENGMRFNNYAAERQNQQGAASLAPSLFGSQFAGVPAYLSAAQGATSIPLMGPSSGLGVGQLWSGLGTTTGTQPGGWGSDLLNAAASIGSAAIMASDRRLKTNIERIGDWDDRGDGLGKYRWNWKADPDGPVQTGVIADEVERLRPQAFVPNFNGPYAGVNYARLGK